MGLLRGDTFDAAGSVAREEFCTAYSKDEGVIRSLYPTDRARREFFFDTWGTGSMSGGDDEGTPPDDGVDEGGD